MLLTFCIIVGILLIVQAIFYILPSDALSLKNRRKNSDFEPVSIIIACRNESENLKKNLPSILNQDYEDFEVVVVDDNSSDSSLEMLKSIEDSRLTIVRNSGEGKKAALTEGIKQSRNQILVFIDADCRPCSQSWLREMMSDYDCQNPIVLGYGELEGDTFIAGFSAYDAALIAMQYLGFAKKGHPYMAVGRNLVYSKKIWETVGGFDSHADILSGDDDLFLAEAIRHTSVTVSLSEASKTISPAKSSFKELLRQKSRHVSTSTKYSLLNKMLAGGEIFSRALCFIAIIILACLNVKMALLFACLRLTVVEISLLSFCKISGTKISPFKIILFDIFAPVFYLCTLIYKIIKPKNQWK